MDNELIRKYLANELSPAERNAFEKEMENDPFLKEGMEGLEEWHAHGNISKTASELNENIDKKVQSAQKGRIIPMRFFRFAVAACVIGILALVSSRLITKQASIDEQKIYAQYFKPLTNPDATVRGEDGVSEESKAIQAYENEDYFEAVNAYQKLVANNPDNVKNNLFLAISLLGTNQPKKTIDILSKLTKSEAFHYDIQWYLALAYIKNKQLQEAQEVLQNLANEDNYYRKEAAEIIEKLNGKVALRD